MPNNNLKFTKNNSFQFLKYLYFGKVKKEEDIYKKCIFRAYRDFNRTLHGFYKNENKNIIYKTCEEIIIKEIKNIISKNTKKENFDKWHKNLCFLLIEEFKNNNFILFVGQSQKWINMTIKYLFIFKEELNIKDEIFLYTHIPIDNIILEKLNYKKFKTSWSRIKSYEEYFSFQEEIRLKYKIPFEIEFNLFMS